VRTGIAISRPNWVSFSPSVCDRDNDHRNIIQIMKHTVNASVLMITTDQALYCDATAIPLWG
jgi:hypothetical protein